MTNSKIFDEIGCPDDLKECNRELKRAKKYIKKQSDIIFALEKEIQLNNYEIKTLKERSKNERGEQ